MRGRRVKSVENWLYDWAMNVEMREGDKQAERQTDRQAAENDEGIYTDNLFNNFMSSKSNKSYKRHNDDGDDDDDDDDGRWKRRRRRHRRSKVRLQRRAAPNDAAQVEVEQGEGAKGARERERRESSSSPSWVVYLVLFGFGLAFWSAAASLWIDAQSFGWMKSVWELLSGEAWEKGAEGGGGCGVADDAMAMNGECARECGIMFLLMLSNGHNNCKLPALENLQLPPRHTHIHMHTHSYMDCVCGPKEKRNLLVIYFRLHGVKCTAAAATSWVECSSECCLLTASANSSSCSSSYYSSSSFCYCFDLALSLALFASCFALFCFRTFFDFSDVCFDLLWKFGFHYKQQRQANEYVSVFVRVCVWVSEWVSERGDVRPRGTSQVLTNI